MLLSLCLDLRRPWPDVLQLAQTADTAGLYTAYVPDHFMPFAPVGEVRAGEVLEGWTVLSALATSTHQVRLGSLVLGNTYRHPAVVANMAATLDQLSGGRVTLGSALPGSRTSMWPTGSICRRSLSGSIASRRRPTS